MVVRTLARAETPELEASVDNLDFFNPYLAACCHSFGPILIKVNYNISLACAQFQNIQNFCNVLRSDWQCDSLFNLTYQCSGHTDSKHCHLSRKRHQIKVASTSLNVCACRTLKMLFWNCTHGPPCIHIHLDTNLSNVFIIKNLESHLIPSITQTNQPVNDLAYLYSKFLMNNNFDDQVWNIHLYSLYCPHFSAHQLLTYLPMLLQIDSVSFRFSVRLRLNMMELQSLEL